MKVLVGPILLFALTLHLGHEIRYPVLSRRVDTDCRQSKTQQSSLLHKAQNRKYTLRRIELIGNKNISDAKLRNRILLREGEFFAQKKLMQSLTSLSKLKAIYPVSLSDVVVHLNDEEKTVDMTICVREKPATSGVEETGPATSAETPSSLGVPSNSDPQ